MSEINHPELGAYFYPLSTKCPERQRRAVDLGYTVVDETQLVQEATPLFDGHNQPVKYCLGTTDSTNWDDADQESMSKQVELAREHGVDFFVFDSYIGYKNGQAVQELGQPLDDAFLNIDASKKMKFALMVCLGSPRVVLPVPAIKEFDEPNRYYDLTQQTSRLIIDECIKKYWEQPNYLRINGKPYLSIFTSDLGGPKHQDKKSLFTQLIGEMKEYSLKKYGTDIYILGVIRKLSSALDLQEAGVDALTGYAFLPEFGQDSEHIQDYDTLLDRRVEEWKKIQKGIKIPFVPPAVVGWDASPRGQSNYLLTDVQGIYPYTPIVIGNSPEKFGKMLKLTADHIEKSVPENEKYLIVCAWNEIGEGCSLLPRVEENSVNFEYLEQIKKFRENI